MSPHETLFLDSTTDLEIKYVASNPYVQFEVWDFPGDIMFKGEAAAAAHLALAHSTAVPFPAVDAAQGKAMLGRKALRRQRCLRTAAL